jgi:phage N-6-adenine-methyltransferase
VSNAACRHCRKRFTLKAVGRPQLYCSTSCRQAAGRRRKRQPAYFSTVTAEWGTPRDLFDKLDTRFGPFTLDVCATAENAKCERYFTKADDALMQTWDGTCWMNPPYGRGIGYWVAKAHDSARAGATVICLLPVRTDTIWWQRFVVTDGEVEFIAGRVRFNGTNTKADCAPFPSCAVVFRRGLRRVGQADERHDET